MAQAADSHTTSRFHNLSNEALADALGEADAVMKTDKRDSTILSASRAPNGLSENTGSIPAVVPPDVRPSDKTGPTGNVLPPAQSARTSRRALIMNSIVSAAALSTAVAVPASEPDTVLRGLWSEYLARAAAVDAASEKYIPARAAFDAELPPCPKDVLPGHHWDAHQWLWDKHVEAAHRDVEDARDALNDVVTRILATEASGLFGIGVKLAALPPNIFLYRGLSTDPDDYVASVASVLNNINRLIGTDFVGIEENFEDEEDEDGEDEAEA